VDHLVKTDSDLVVGSRFKEPGKYRQTFSRLFGGWVLRRLICLMTGQDISDCTSGFRAANRRVIRAFAHWYPEDYPEPEVILLLHRAGYAIGEFSVRMRQRRVGQSSIGLLGGLFYVLKVTTCLLLDTVRAPWPHEKFGVPAPRPAPGLEPAPQPPRPAPQSNAHDAQEPDPPAAWREPVRAGRPAAPHV
jgi:hypothetical protein